MPPGTPDRQGYRQPTPHPCGCPTLTKIRYLEMNAQATTLGTSPATARRPRAPKATRTVRDMIRKHLYDERVPQKDLAGVWKCSPTTVAAIMANKNRRLITATQIDALVELLHLDEFDATELHRKAALEAGYRIDGPSIDDFQK